MPKTPWILALTAVFLLLLLGHGFGTEEQSVPTRSQVHYDPQLTEDAGKCYVTSFGTKNRVILCEASLLGPNTIDLVIKNRVGVCYEWLRSRITKGMFECDYSVSCKYPHRRFRCTTKRQELTLDKKEYRKGDLVTGRIDFECLVECPECPEKPETVIVKGVFKTILK